MTDDRTDDSDAVSIGGTGVLVDLMERQSEVANLISAAAEETDKTTMDGLLGSIGYPVEVVTAVVLAHMETSEEPRDDITQFDIILAGAFLDHLDTQGYRIAPKKIKKVKRDRSED
jgi:hypothetical protein